MAAFAARYLRLRRVNWHREDKTIRLAGLRTVGESARKHIQVGFWDYARFGIRITIFTTAASVLVVLLIH